MLKGLPYEIYCTPERYLVEVSVKLALFEVVQHTAVEVFMQEVLYQGPEVPGPQSEVPQGMLGQPSHSIR